jgi:hypothetical protein
MIDPTIEKALAPSRASWKDNIYQSKLFAFLTSSALAWTLLVAVLAASYVLLKMPPLAPQTEPTMTIEPIPQVTDKSTVQKRAKGATENVAAKSTNTPASDGFYGLKPHEKPPEKTVKKPRIDDGFTAEFDKQVLNLESKL